MSSKMAQELAQAEQIPPIRIADLIMMQMLGEKAAVRFDKFLQNFVGPVNYETTMRQIAQTKGRVTSPKMYEDFAKKIATQQFGDGAVVLRELTQNGIDAYTLTDTQRKVLFSLDEDREHTVLRTQDFGVGMSLQEIVRFLLIPLNTTKDKDIHKIGEHGVGWSSVIGLSDLVKVRSRKRGASKVAQVIVRKRDHNIEALLSDHEADMQEGTEVTLYIPRGVKNMDRTSIRRQLTKYVGYVDPQRAEITLDGAPVNTLCAEYLTGLPGDVKVNDESKALVFSFSKRALHADFHDERFDERNKNLQHIVYTQSGLLIKYGSNPFEVETIHQVLFNDLIATGLDFWIQLPEGLGLTIGRNDVVPEHSNELLEASYEAFWSLFIESIITDQQILYHPSQALQKGITRLMSTDGYLDHARSKMVRKYSFKKRVLSNIMPLAAGSAKGLKVGLKFLVIAPFKLVYYVALVIWSLCAAALTSFMGGGYKTMGKGLAAASLAAAIIYGGHKLYTTDWMRPPDVATAGKAEAPFAQAQFSHSLPPERIPVTPELSPKRVSPRSSTESQRPEVIAPLPPISYPARTQLPSRLQPADVPMVAQIGQPDHEQLEPTALENTGPPNMAAQEAETRGSQPEASLRETLGTASAALHEAKAGLATAANTTVDALRRAKENVEGQLSFIPDEYLSATAYGLLSLAAAFGTLCLAYATTRVTRTFRINLGSMVRCVGQLLLFPLYPVFLAGKGLFNLLCEATGLFARHIGLYTNIEEKKRRLYEARRAEIIERYKSQFETNRLLSEIMRKKILNATQCEVEGGGNWNLFRGTVPGKSERISIEELIDLYVADRVRVFGEANYRVHNGDYFVDKNHWIIRQVLAMLEPIKNEISQRYDPKVLEDRLDTVRDAAGSFFKFLYLVSGIGLIQIFLSFVYQSIPNPYADTEAYKTTAAFLKGVPDMVEETGPVLKVLAMLPVYAVLGIGYGAYYVCLAIVWVLKRILWPTITSPKYVPEGIVALCGVTADGFHELIDGFRELWEAWREYLIRRRKTREEQRAATEQRRRADLEIREKARLAEEALNAEKAAAAMRRHEERQERKEAWRARGGIAGIIGSYTSAVYEAVWKSIVRLFTGYRDVVTGKCRIDESRLRRIVEYAQVGQNYERFLDAADRMDSLLSEALQLPKLTISYQYPSAGADSVFGKLKSGKKPRLHLGMDDNKMLHMIDKLDSRSEMIFTLLESLLHQKTHQTGLHHYDPLSQDHFYERKERLRRQFYEHMQRQGLTVEDCLDQSLRRRSDHILDFVPAEELARLSKFRILGLMQERERRGNKSSRSA
ncbi:MAG: ATP-binding protein [Acidobacteria bacterium]|nr:ATP-binding protein [Acidobacteriota bacterium]